MPECIKIVSSIVLTLATATPAFAQSIGSVAQQTTQQLDTTSVLPRASLPVARLSLTPRQHIQTRTLRIPRSGCTPLVANAASRVGLTSRTTGPDGVQGNTPTAVAALLCVTLPRAGPCERDGASLLIAVASGESLSDARTLAQRLDQAVGNPVLIDCN
jgi:hypothetical protein